MKLPTTTSKLLALQEATNAALHGRLEEIFKRYRGMAFIGRDDKLFSEHWTPEQAAAGYVFDGFEIKEGNIVLHGTENACGFIYRISIGFPTELVDHPNTIEDYFQRIYAETKAASEQFPDMPTASGQ
jgi:hypothetical protein